MRIEFECQCGESISDFTRGNADEMSVRIVCDKCGKWYAVTVSDISQ